MKTFARASVTIGIALALSLAAHAAFAIEYDDVIQYTKQNVSDRAIVELIVKDGRAFKMSSDERNELRDAGVSEIVIRSMTDPDYGADWLAGKIETPEDYNDDQGDVQGDTRDQVDDGGPLDQGGESGNGYGADEDGIVDEGGYGTPLDAAYGNGLSADYVDGHTSLIFSFGYYYGPLARYYYCDPFYYPFWYHGYASSYWPSYYAYWWRPRYDWCYAYPYNYFNYNSYYCYTYYDPGYWAHNGYRVQPGYGRTIWDGGPRWRNGGVPPAGGGRPATRDHVLGGRFADAGGLGNGGAYRPPVIREAVLSGGLRDRAGNRTPGAPAGSIERTPVGRGPISRELPIARGPGRGSVDPGAVSERPRRTISGGGLGAYLRDREPSQRTQPMQRGEQPRIIRGGSWSRGYDSGRTQGRGGASGIPPHGSVWRGNGQGRAQPAAPAPRNEGSRGRSGGGERTGGERGVVRGSGDHGSDHGSKGDGGDKGGGGGDRGRGR